MSKISGIDLGNPNEPFFIQGNQLGGRDGSVVVQRPSANVRRDSLANLAKHLTERLKEIRSAIESLEMLGEMMVVDEETDSVILDKQFIEEYSTAASTIGKEFEEILKAINQR